MVGTTASASSGPMDHGPLIGSNWSALQLQLQLQLQLLPGCLPVPARAALREKKSRSARSVAGPGLASYPAVVFVVVIVGCCSPL